MPLPAPDIFAFLDYRAYLRAWFEWKKSTHTRFSHRGFAKLAGHRSPSLLLEVMTGRRGLTAANEDGFAHALRLRADERVFFGLLIRLEQAETHAEKNDAWDRIRATKRFREARQLDGQAYELLADWTHVAIHELARTPEFRPDADWVSKALRPRVSVAHARKALETLRALGMLRVVDGRTVAVQASVVTPHEVEGLAAHAYHGAMLAHAQNAIESFAPDERHLVGLTVAIPSALMPLLKSEINAFQERLLELCDGADATPDRVYQLSLALFPLTGVSGGES